MTQEEDDDEQDLKGFADEGLRKKIQKEIEEKIQDEKGSTPCCGVWWGPVSCLVVGWCKVLEFIAGFLATRIPCFKPEFIKKNIVKAYKLIGSGLKKLNGYILKGIVKLVLPKKDGAYSVFDIVMLVLSCIYILSLAAQTDNFHKYKCGCQDLKPIETAVPCAYSQSPVCADGTKCFGGLCLSEWANTPCINPWANPAVAQQEKRLGAREKSLTSSAELWIVTREYYCSYSRYLHFIILGCAFLFFMEFVLKFTAHQGPLRFLLKPKSADAGKGSALSAKKVNPAAQPPPKKSIRERIMAMIISPISERINRIHTRNVIDSICILITVGGVVFTDLTFEVQVRKCLVLPTIDETLSMSHQFDK